MKQYFFICPRCRTNLDRVSDDCLVCPQDGLEYLKIDGIWRFLLPESQAHFQRFMEEHESARSGTAGSPLDENYFRSLPYEDVTGNESKGWEIRAASFDFLVKKLLTPIQAQLERPLKVIDVGAGNGWLSNQLAFQEDRVVAIDLLANDQDGLGAWKYYDNSFTPIQAEFNHLPIMDGFADVTVFNASFHYSENYEETLIEALRATDMEGVIVIMDSPLFRNQAAGEGMIAEGETNFPPQFGFAADALKSETFLTQERVSELGKALGIDWLMFRPSYGLGWQLRPLVNWLTRKPEPVSFPLITGYKKEA